MNSLFFEGFFLQASLIFALGAQNLFVLESGLKKEHHLWVSLVCCLCDLTLITLGVAGAGTLFAQFPFLKIIIGVLGIFFLFQYGMSKVFFFSAEKLNAQYSLTKNSLKTCILLSITFSILNPHAYLDAFILIGGFSSKYELLSDRLVLGFGAAAFSGVWFILISSLASVLKPILDDPLRMRKVMCVAGMALIALSGKLSIDVYSWMTQEIVNPFAFKNIIDYPMISGNLFTSITY